MEQQNLCSPGSKDQTQSQNSINLSTKNKYQTKGQSFNISLGSASSVQHNKPIQAQPGSFNKIDVTHKFMKTLQRISQSMAVEPIQQNNKCQGEENESFNAQYAYMIINQIIQEIISKTASTLLVLQKVGQTAINQTFSVIINNPYIGISNQNLQLPEHRQNKLSIDHEPKPAPLLDVSIGHVKIQQIKLLKKTSSNLQSNLRLTKNKNKMVKSRYSFHKKSSMIFPQNEVLPPILQRNLKYITKIDKERNQSIKVSQLKRQALAKNNHKQLQAKKIISHKTQPSQACQLISLLQQKPQSQADKNDNYINYLRFIKYEDDKIKSLNTAQRNQINKEYNISTFNLSQQNSTDKISNNCSRRTSIIDKRLVSSKLISCKNIQQNMSQIQSKKQIDAFNYYELSDEIKQKQKIMSLLEEGVGKKNLVKYSNCISINQSQIIQDNAFGVDITQLKQLVKRQRIRSGKCKQKQDKKVQLKQGPKTSKDSVPLKKDTGINSAKERVNPKTHKNQHKQKQQLKLPQVFNNNMNKINKEVQVGFHEQLAVWFRDKRKIKDFDHKFNQFINIEATKYQADDLYTNSSVKFKSIKPAYNLKQDQPLADKQNINTSKQIELNRKNKKKTNYIPGNSVQFQNRQNQEPNKYNAKTKINKKLPQSEKKHLGRQKNLQKVKNQYLE